MIKKIKAPYKRIPRKFKKQIKNKYRTRVLEVRFSFINGISYYLVSK